MTKDSVFEERYARLNPRQREAVDTIDGPVMVIAGPGTGKTTVLTLRIANILRQTDTPPSGILAITYTDAGVKQMRRKLREIAGARADEVRVHTFHSFAASLIAEFPEHFPSRHRAKQATAAEVESILRAIVAGEGYADLRPLGAPDLYLPKISDAISESKREAWTPEMLRAHAKAEIKRIKGDPASISTRGETKGKLKADAAKAIERAGKTALLADVYEAYEARKAELKLMDYDDLLSELLRALREDELFLRLVQEKFLYISVDEHQDTNDVQNAIVRAIADFFDDPNLFVVGDEKQAIFRFQGASVDNFLRFQSVWKSMRLIPLSDNYRSHQGVLDAGFELIERNYGEGEHESLRVRLSAGRGSARLPIDVVEAGNAEAMHARLVADVKAFLASSPEGDVAVIASKNRHVSKVAAVLEAAGVPAVADRGADVLKHPIGALFFRLAEAFADPSSVEALAATVAAGLWGLPYADGAALVRDVRAGKLDGLDSRLPRAAELRERRDATPPLEFVMRMGHSSGLVARASRDPIAAEVWRALYGVSSRLVQEGGLGGAKALLDALLEYERSAQSRGVKVRIGPVDARVSVMTAHASKGQEFDRVFIVNATEDAWATAPRASWFSLPRAADPEDHMRDARRLFYVALTRARDHVSILYPLVGDDGRELMPAGFIGELGEANLRRHSVPAAREAAFEDSSATVDSMRRKAREDYAKRYVLERGVSPSALNDFLACPSRFYLKHVLGLSELPNPKAEKGNALHAGIRDAWRLDAGARSDAKRVAAALGEAAAEYLAGSLLASGDKEAVRKELEAEIPAIAKALVPHFALGEGAEVRAEQAFEGALPVAQGAEALSVPLRGKIDAVISSGELVRVFDYKARDAMSEASIRGETKDSTGDYFRQLSFYARLLSPLPAYKGKRMETSLMFIKPDAKGACRTATVPVTSADIATVEAALRGLVDSVWSGRLLSSRCDDPECGYCALLN